MVRVHSTFAILFIPVVAVGAAAAQRSMGMPETGTLITNRPAEISGTDSPRIRQFMQRFGACAVRERSGLVKEALSVPVGTSQYSKLMRRVASDTCLAEGSAKMPFTALRGALFESLYQKGLNLVDPGQVPKFDYRANYARPLTPDAINAIALGEFGDCVARADTDAARALLRTAPSSAAENAVIQRLLPRFSPCLTSGAKVSFSRLALRGAVAEGLYRSSVAPSAPTGVH